MENEVVIIGGGPAGLMAAVAAAEEGACVTLFEKGDKVGRKLALSGGGRCNLTNAMPTNRLVGNIPGNGRFLYSALSRFDNQDIISFFERLGIPLKEEDHGRIFPVSGNAQSVVQALSNRLHQLKVRIKAGTPVAGLHIEDEHIMGIVLPSGEKIKADKVIVAVGGMSIPGTGSSGDGYGWARRAGHTVTELYPAEVPLTSPDLLIQNRTLQGLALRDTAVTLLRPDGKAINSQRWDLLFTHFGLSGPAALRLSRFVVQALKKYKADSLLVRIDPFPDINEEELCHRLQQLVEKAPEKNIKNVWKNLLPERYLLYLLESLGISGNICCRSIRREDFQQFIHLLKNFEVQINGTLPIERAFVTGGGISLKEIDPKTMASRKTSGLYFCGEILDIQGYTGGFNITAAFVTGHAAGKSAAGITGKNEKI